jgi:hypothetical protein
MRWRRQPLVSLPPCRPRATSSSSRTIFPRQNLSGRQVVDLFAMIQSVSQLDDHAHAPPAPASPVPGRPPPPPCHRKPRLTAAAGRLQANDESAETSTKRSPPLGLAVQGVARLETGSPHRVTQHRPAVAAPPLLRVLGQTLHSRCGGTPARKPPDQGPRRTNGSGQSSPGRASNPRRTAEAGN